MCTEEHETFPVPAGAQRSVAYDVAMTLNEGTGSLEEKLRAARHEAVVREMRYTVEVAREEAEAAAEMKRLTPEFITQADKLGFHPSPVVTARWDKGSGKLTYEQTLGEGWLVTDQTASNCTEYGDPRTRFVIMREGPWVDAGWGQTSITEAPPIRRHGFPPGFDQRPALILDVTGRPVQFRTRNTRGEKLDDVIVQEFLRLCRKA